MRLALLKFSPVISLHQAPSEISGILCSLLHPAVNESFA